MFCFSLAGSVLEGSTVQASSQPGYAKCHAFRPAERADWLVSRCGIFGSVFSLALLFFCNSACINNVKNTSIYL